MDKLNQLLSLCKCSVSVTVNNHRDYYESVKDSIDENEKEEIPLDVFNKMVETDTIVDVHFYPNTPVGFYRVLHYDIDMALDIALESFNQ